MPVFMQRFRRINMLLQALVLFAVAAALQVLLVFKAAPFFTKIADGGLGSVDDKGVRRRSLLSFSR
jgi:hypothetical protein